MRTLPPASLWENLSDNPKNNLTDHLLPIRINRINRSLIIRLGIKAEIPNQKEN